MRVLNKEVFGRVEVQKKEALSRISFLDDLEKEKALSLEESEERKKAREEFKKWVDLEEVSWRQKSRKTWLKKGDRNTSFFHRMANSHRRRNSIRNISDLRLEPSKISFLPQATGAHLSLISGSM